MVTKSSFFIATLAVLGVSLILIGVFVGNYIFDRLGSGIEENAKILPREQNEDKYDDWLDNSRDGVAPYYYSFYLYNITNPGDIADFTSAPVVEEIGPYVYREWSIKYNVTFSSDDSKVTYNTFTQYEWVPELSGEGLDQSDFIVQAYPTYLGLFGLFGSDTAINMVLAAGLLNQTILEYGFVARTLYGGDVSPLAGTLQWGSLGGVSGHFGPGVSVMTSNDILTTWASVDPFMRGIISRIWMKYSYGPEYAHWSATAAGGSKLTIAPDLLANWFWGVGETRPACPLLMNDVDGVPCFVKVISRQIASPCIDVSCAAQMQDLLTWMMTYAGMMWTTVFEMLGTVDGNNKLWQRRTVRDWLWVFTDPLLKGKNTAYFPYNYSSIDAAYLGDPTTSTQFTGADDVDKAGAWDGYKSMSTFPSRDGYDFRTPGVWCQTDQKVEGHDPSQFPPGFRHGLSSYHTDADVLESPAVFVSDVWRPAKFKVKDHPDYYDIPTTRLAIADEEFQPNPAYDQFYPGVLNQTCPNGGLPALLTLPHYLQAEFPEELRVKGVSEPDEEKHNTWLYVDPISGATVSGYQRLQLNYPIPAELAGEHGPKFVPVWWLEKHSEMTEDQRDDYANSVTYAINLQKGVFLGFTISGSLLVVIALVWGVYVATRSKDANLDQNPVLLATEDNVYQQLGDETSYQ